MTTARLIGIATALAALVLLPAAGLAQKGDPEAPTSSLGADARYFTVGNHFFAPADITVEAGRSLHLVVTNGTYDHMHDFIIMSPSGALVGGSTAVIQPGQRVEFDWTPLSPGLYRILCAVCPAEEEMLALVHVL